jgi:hypothetical protein
MAPHTTLSPPKTPVAFRVGVSGHRPNRLRESYPEQLGAVIDCILKRVREDVLSFQARPQTSGAYLPDPPRLCVASSLAEGADRLVAAHALDLGFSLCCPMPFAQAEYERDFDTAESLEPRSLETFRSLLERARAGADLTTFELDGSRSDPGAAYGAAGRIVINQSDLLIVVWDGREAQGSGGTIQTLHEAIHYQVPIVWIDAVAPHHWQLILVETDLPELAPGERCSPHATPDADWRQLSAVIQEILEWPPADAEPGEDVVNDLRGVYFHERKPRWNPAPFWKLFRNLAGDGRLRLPPLRVQDFEASARAEWPIRDERPAGVSLEAPETAAEWANGRLRSHFAWADRLADFYADKYRSSFILAYPLAALAVVLALFPVTIEPLWRSTALEITCLIAELATVAAILGLIFIGKLRRWHDRWMEYRVLAEVIRQLRVLIPLGGGRPFIRVPGHLKYYGEPSRTWMFAFMRALGRSTGLPSARVDPAYVVQCLHHLRSIVAGQHRFHEINEHRLERIAHTLHRTAFMFLAFTILAILLHLVPFLHLSDLHFLHEPAVSRWFTLAAASLPAFGSALAGINNQGEFSRVAKRSRAMAHRMKHVEGEIDTLAARAAVQRGCVRLEHVTPLALYVVQLMIDENLEWRVVFTDRPPTLPA